MDSLFFIFSKVLTIFLYPLPVFFFLCLYLLFRIKPGKIKFRFFLVCLFLYLASSSFVANSLVSSLEKDYPPISIQDTPNADLAIVLGGMIQTISSVKARPELTDSADRITDAVRLYKAGKVKKILFTGGSGLLLSDEFREATLAKSLLIDLGVRESDIILENNSRNTYENAVETKKIVEKLNFKSYILITSAFHMKRASGCFQKQNLNVFLFPTDYRSFQMDSGAFELYLPSAGYLDTTTFAIKEWVGYFVYRAKSYL
ncbi:YdcF family protein [Leptospira levettii]|uniref:YdcF family protein n=1 Tax=Leptospira levettii TaxID=2023178 RepID=A0AAW5V341_9LEPT|nr:YdcF family protein [Leptospira levettii]MCW7464755.1 YdcF family protein [Leptospira levettii]MCW7511061.1 YdcF family protein [Leptospira levettii]MCW7514815.1 YdcF family protein [Leptospira levettii]